MQQPMRRKDREITDVGEKLKIIDSLKVCRLAMNDDGQPYIVPLNFGYKYEGDKLTLFFHGAKEGRKINVLRADPRVCFKMDGQHQLIENEVASEYSFAFESVIGEGRVEFIEDPQGKAEGLSVLMKHQTGRDFTFNEKDTENVAVYKVEAAWFTCKRRPMPPTRGE